MLGYLVGIALCPTTCYKTKLLIFHNLRSTIFFLVIDRVNLSVGTWKPDERVVEVSVAKVINEHFFLLHIKTICLVLRGPTL